MIYDKLFDWQKKIVDNNLWRSSFGLFLDCGLGKTPLSLAFAEKHECDKILIITINSKAIETEDTPGSWWNWASQSAKPYVIQNKKILKRFKPCDVLILNYESLFERGSDLKRKVTLKKEIQLFLNGCIDKNFALIIDESHKMKNLQSLQTAAILEIQKTCKIYCNQCYTYLLTGTPFTVGYIDLYTQLKALGCPMLKGDFIDRFCIRDHRPGLLGWQQPIIGYQNLDALYDLIHQYALTIKSKEVLDLPDQLFVNHPLKESQSFRLLIKDRLPANEIRDALIKRGIDASDYRGSAKAPNPFYRNVDYPDIKFVADTPGALWLRARQLSIGFQGNAEESVWYDKSRLAELYRFLEQNEDNYVIFYNYTPELLELYDICESLGYNIDVYCGEAKSLVFYDRFHKLPEEEKLVTKKNVILANFASGSTGMNWQEYNKCILFSMPLYGDWEQGLKRLHRIGQKSSVIYHIFYETNWLDLGMKRALEEKIQYTEDMFKTELLKEGKDE